MADLKSSKEKVQQVKNNLISEEALQQINNTNQVMVSLIKQQNSSIQQLNQTLEIKESEEKDANESINNTLRSSIGYLTSISGKLSSIQNSMSSLQGAMTSATQNTEVTVSLLGSIKTSLIQITSVLSAFRADYIMANNGKTIKGEGFYDQQLLLQDLSTLGQIKNKALQQSIQNMQKAANFANKMSNAVRPRVGNNKLANDSGKGLIGGFLDKLLPEDMKEFGPMITQFLPMFGIQDGNFKDVASSIMNLGDPNRSKKYLDPINQAVTDILNGPQDSSGKGIFKQILAGKANELLGFGDAESKTKETDPNLVMSSLAPFADDIVDLVKAKYQAVSKIPDIIPEYATPVWVVNSSFQENGLENKHGKDLITKGNAFKANRIEKAIKGQLNNQKDENGNDLFKFDTVTGEMGGKIVEDFIELNQIQNASYNEKFNILSEQINAIKDIEKDKKKKSTYTFRDATKRIGQAEVENPYKAFTEENSELVEDISSLLAQGDIFKIRKIGGKLFNKDERKKYFSGAFDDAKNFASGIKGVVDSNKKQELIEQRALNFKRFFSSELFEKLEGYNDEDKNTISAEAVEIIYNKLNFLNNENKVLSDFEDIKSSLLADFQTILPEEEDPEEIYSLAEDSLKKVLTGEKPEKKKGFFGRLFSKGTHKGGKKPNPSDKTNDESNSDIGYSTEEKEIRSLAPSDTVATEKEVEKFKSIDDVAAGTFILAAGVSSLVNIETQSIFYLGQAVNLGKIEETEPKNIKNPFVPILNILNGTTLKKKEIGKKINKAINNFKDNSNMKKVVEEKEEEIEAAERMTDDEYWGRDKEKEEEKKEENKKPTLKDLLFGKTKKKIAGKIKDFGDLAMERIGLAKMRLGKTKIGKKIKGIVGFTKNVKTQIKGRINNLGKKIGDGIWKKTKSIGKKVFGGLKSVGEKIKNSKIGKAIASSKIGKSVGGMVKKGLGLFKAETEQEKLEREKTEAERERLKKEKEEKEKTDKEQDKEDKKEKEKEEKEAKENADKEKANAEQIRDQNSKSADQVNKIEEDSEKNSAKLQEQSDKQINKINENSEKNIARTEENAENTQATMETQATATAEVSKLQGAQGEAEADTSQNKVLGALKAVAKVAVIGGSIASGISLIRSLMSGKKSKGKLDGKDSNSGQTKEDKKAQREAEKEKKKAEKEKAKEEKKKKRKEKRKKFFKGIVNKSVFGIFTRTKVYVDEDGYVINAKTKEHIKMLDEDGNETEEDLNIKHSKKGKKQFLNRLMIKKELMLVANKDKIKKVVKKGLNVAKKGLKTAFNLSAIGLVINGTKKVIKGVNNINEKVSKGIKKGKRVLFGNKGNRIPITVDKETGNIINTDTKEPVMKKDGSGPLTDSDKDLPELKERLKNELIWEEDIKKGLIDKTKDFVKDKAKTIGKNIVTTGEKLGKKFGDSLIDVKDNATTVIKGGLKVGKKAAGLVKNMGSKQLRKLMKLMMISMNPAMFMSPKMTRKLLQLQRSPMGKMMMNKSEKASDLLFNTSPASTALGLVKTAAKTGINLANVTQNTLDGLGGFLSGLFGKKINVKKKTLSQDLNDGTFSENASVAYNQSRSREISNRFIDAFTKSLNIGDSSKKADNGDLYTTSKIVNEERKKKAIHVGVVGPGTGSVAGVSGSGSGGTLSTVIPYSEYGTWRQGDSRWSSVKCESIQGDSGGLIGPAGCSLTSTAIMLCHAGLINDSSFNPGTFAEDINTREDAHGSCGSANPMSHMCEYKGDKSLQPAEGVDHHGSSGVSADWDKIYNGILEAMTKGYFCIGWVYNHYVFIDYIDTANKVIYICDPAGWCNCWIDENNKPASFGEGDKAYYCSGNGDKNRKIQGYVTYKSSKSSASVYVLNGRRSFDSFHPNGDAPNATIFPSGSGSTSSVAAGGTVTDWFINDWKAQGVSNAYMSSPLYRNGSGAWHGGNDYSGGNIEGKTKIHTPVGGKVLEAGDTGNGYGNFVRILGNDGKCWTFGHMYQQPSVKKGDTVVYGQEIGIVGNTGMSTGPHLHVDIGDNENVWCTNSGSKSQVQDPSKYIVTGKGKNNEKQEFTETPDTEQAYELKSNDKDKKSKYGMGKPHLYQRDYFNVPFNNSNDTEKQTLADSGCGPACASTVKKIFGKGKPTNSKQGGDSLFGRANNSENSSSNTTQTNENSSSNTSQTSEDSTSNLNNTNTNSNTSTATASINAVGKSGTETLPDGSTIDVKITDKTVELFNMCREIGMSDAAAAGALASFAAECGSDFSAATADSNWAGPIGPGNSAGMGIMQWTPCSVHYDWCSSHNFAGKEKTWEASIAHAKDYITNCDSWGIKRQQKDMGQITKEKWNDDATFDKIVICNSIQDYFAINDPEVAAVCFERIFEYSGDFFLSTSEAGGAQSTYNKWASYNMYYSFKRRKIAKLYFQLLNGTYNGSLSSSASPSTSSGIALTGWVDLIGDTYVSADSIKNYVNSDSTNNMWDKYFEDKGITNSVPDLSSELTPSVPSTPSPNPTPSSTATPSPTPSTNNPTPSSTATPTNDNNETPTPSSNPNDNNETPTPSSNPTPSSTATPTNETPTPSPNPTPSSTATPTNETPTPSSTPNPTPIINEIPSESILTKSGNNIIVKSSGQNTIVICNNFNDKSKANLEDIVSNFSHLNDTQGKALKVLKAISDLIKEEDNTGTERKLFLNNEGLDLILKGI